MCWRSILIFLLAALCNAAAQGGCISVLVLDHKGAPLAGINVLALSSSFSRSWVRATDATGRVQFTGLPAGTYTMDSWSWELGYLEGSYLDLTNADLLHPVVTESANCLEITIRRGSVAGWLRLKITNQDNGNFIEQPVAQFRRTDGEHAWHAMRGSKLELLVPSEKPVEVRVGAKGYKTSAPFVVQPLRPGEVRDFTAVLKPIGLGCLKGTVLNARGKPVPDVRIDASILGDIVDSRSSGIYSDALGRFEIHDLAIGHYVVTVFSEEQGYDATTMATPGGKLPQAEVSSSDTCAELAVNLKEPNGRLSADVLDAETQLPLKHFRFRVTCPSLPRWWAEGRDFKQVVQVPIANSCSVQADSDGYVTSEPLTLEPFQPGELRKMTFRLNPISNARNTEEQKQQKIEKH